MEKINIGLYGGKSIFGGRETALNADITYCDKYKECSFYKKGKCFCAGRIGPNCKYGTKENIKGYTSRAIKYNEFRRKYKEENGWHGYYNKEIVELTRILEHILSDYKRVLKENEELKKSKITYEKVRDIQEKNKNIVDKNYISVQKVKDKISERQFELQQEYKDFEDDVILIVLQELLEGRK